MFGWTGFWWFLGWVAVCCVGFGDCACMVCLGWCFGCSGGCGLVVGLWVGC